MKKINYKRVSITVLWIIAITGLITSLGFISKSERDIIATSIDITIQNNEENVFLREIDVREFFDQRGDNILNSCYNQLSIPELERALNSHPAIEKAEVSADLNGEIKVNILQRTPVLRVINKNGESYYIDSQSKLMPLNENYSARVLIASGEIDEPYSRRSEYSIQQMKKSNVFKDLSVLDDIYDIANYINGDTCLTALIHQLSVTNEKEIEMYPVIGNQKIIFGDANDIAEKFNKLKLFYQQGLNKTDSWMKYKAINLKYKNLVVCTKK